MAELFLNSAEKNELTEMIEKAERNMALKDIVLILVLPHIPVAVQLIKVLWLGLISNAYKYM